MKFFWCIDMNCSNCGSKMEKGWRHCPNCGIRIGGGYSRDDMFSQIFREMDELTKSMGFRVERDMEVIDLSRMVDEVMKNMAGQNRRGFSIRINQRNNEPPRVSFRRIGQEAGNVKRIVPKLRKPVDSKQNGHKLGIKLPDDTSEPETVVSRSGNKIIVEIRLPGVKAAGDIDINELESSVEIKALAGGGRAADAAGSRGYFKIIRKPDFSRIVSRKFEAGVLRLEIL
jgi:HSP20 family molecular chaperone IbpA